MERANASDELLIGGQALSSRLFLGTGTYSSLETMGHAIEASATQVVTVAMRRVSTAKGGESVFDVIRNTSGGEQIRFLPNTAGCFTARDAVLTAQLAREALGTSWIKLEVIGDDHTLYPDVPELLKAAEILVNDDFVVLPYCPDDPVTCKKLEDIGCAAVMPLGSPIGSGMGILNRYNLKLIREMCEVPVVLDAGVGTASDATIAMELGCDAVLLSTAVSGAHDPVRMATAMRKAVEAGRLAYLAGRIPKRLYARASSAQDGLIES